MNNIAIILDALAMVLGVSYALLALAEDFFQYISGHQAARTICLHVGERTFQVLPQGYLTALPHVMGWQSMTWPSFSLHQ